GGIWPPTTHSPTELRNCIDKSPGRKNRRSASRIRETRRDWNWSTRSGGASASLEAHTREKHHVQKHVRKLHRCQEKQAIRAISTGAPLHIASVRCVA